jgi:hypothetical protein
MIEGMFGIAVFVEDSALLQHATLFWSQRMPSYCYDYALDGGAPVPAPRGTADWYGQTVFNASTSGIVQGVLDVGCVAVRVKGGGGRVEG